MDILQFIDTIQPNHTRTSCNDAHTSNGFYTRDGKSWHGRCTRCMYLELARGIAFRGEPIPENINPEELHG